MMLSVGDAPVTCSAIKPAISVMTHQTVTVDIPLAPVPL